METPADGANGGFGPSGGIERAVIWIMLTMGVALFFWLAVAGMDRVEKLTTEPTRLHPHTAEAPASEIGGLQGQ